MRTPWEQADEPAWSASRTASFATGQRREVANSVGGNAMEVVESTGMHRTESGDVNRRTAVSRLIIGGAAAALFAPGHSAAQDATPDSRGVRGHRTASRRSGIGSRQLLVGGIVHDMPPGPVEVRISRLAMAPGTTHRGRGRALPGPDVHGDGDYRLPGRSRSHWLRTRRHRHRGNDRGGDPVHPCRRRRNTSPPMSRTGPATRRPS